MCVNIIYVCTCLYCVICLILYYRSLLICTNKEFMNILPVLLSICFTCMFKHCNLPISMLDSVIVPLVKNRNGDLSDKNNYRPIAFIV